jgi:dTDP-4-dehydrorhamnose 3,5-epimerase
MPFSFTQTDIPEVILIEPRVFKDARGFFLESFKASPFVEAGITERFVQDNHSRSAKGTLRGLHYQVEPYAQGKLVRVTRGRVWDVAVDLRPESPTFRKWVADELSADNFRMLYIPAGFAHGFVALEDETDFLYKCTAEYDVASERGIRWSDPDLAVPWPVEEAFVSERDQVLPLFSEVFG